MASNDLTATSAGLLPRAIAAHRAGDLDSAAALYRQILIEDPKCASAPINLGAIHRQRGDLRSAREIYERALREVGEHASLHVNYGNLLLDLQEPDPALLHFERALRLEPQAPNAHYGRGIALFRLNCLDQSRESLQSAVHLAPRHALAHDWLGVVLLKQREIEGSIQAFQLALHLDPRLVSAWRNLAGAYKALNDMDRSISAYRRALQLEPKDAAAHLGFGSALLYEGDFEHGWEHLEWRYKLPGRERRLLGQGPIWNGEDLRGQTLWLYTEQGAGDAIQFARYAALLAQRGIKVRLSAPKSLQSLLASLPGVKLADSSKEHAAHCPLLSLPYVLSTRLEDIPNEVPYLTPPKRAVERCSEQLAKLCSSNRTQIGKPKIGLCWAGNPEHENDAQRSLTLQQFKRGLGPLLEQQTAATLFSFQVGPRALQRQQSPQGGAVIDLSTQLHDYADTAAWLCHMDLVISVDTSVAHLAAALGIRTWILLAYRPDWRWLRNRADTPWYPTATLFRQTRIDDWDSALDQASAALTQSPLLLPSE